MTIISKNNAIELLNAGEIVALPTETVYGLAAKITDTDAIKKVFTTKGRPLDHPLIVHIGKKEDVYLYSREQPHYLNKLCNTFWPGPLTIILKKSDKIDSLITAGQDTVAIRMPQHDDTLQIIQSLDSAIVAPSANQYCQTSPSCAQHVIAAFENKVAVYDGGSCDIGIESTIIDATNENKITVLRPGMISPEMIEKVTGVTCEVADTSRIKFSGSHKKHYAPQKPLLVLKDLTELANLPYSYVMSFNSLDDDKHHHVIMPNNPQDYAKELYRHWHLAAALPIANIVIEMPPQTPEWLGIIDKINKAAYKES